MANIPIYIPTYINSATYEPARVLPRLFFYNGTIACQKYFIQDENFSSRTQNAFPYFDNYNVVSGIYPTSDSLSLLFNNENAVYGELPTDTLYTTYWEKYITLLYNPKTRLLDCKAIIPLADYIKMNLNDVVNFKGNYYHLRAINNYSLKTGDCDLQLLGPIIPDTFSDAIPTPPPTIPFATASAYLNEFNSGGVFLDTNLFVSGTAYYSSGNFSQSVSGGVVADVRLEAAEATIYNVWNGYSTGSATLTIYDNGSLVTSSTHLYYSGSGTQNYTIPVTFTAGHNITISGSTVVTGSKSTPTGSTATLSWFYSVTGAPSSNGFGLKVNGSIVESRSNTSSGARSVSVGDIISVVIETTGCVGGGGGTANAYCTGIINDASCASNSTTLTSATYTVVSGDIGNTITLYNYASCDGGCL